MSTMDELEAFTRTPLGRYDQRLDIERMGEAAFKAGLRATDCPYKPGTMLAANGEEFSAFNAWTTGLRNARQDNNAEHMAKRKPLSQ